MTDVSNGGGKPQIGLYADEGYFKTLRQDEVNRVLPDLTDEQRAALDRGEVVSLCDRWGVRIMKPGEVDRILMR